MKIKTLFVLAAAMLMSAHAVAQQLDRTHGLSDEDVAAMTKRATEKVDQFNRQLSLIAQPHRSTDNNKQRQMNAYKDRLIRQCLKLFLGQGEEYEDAYGNKMPPVTIEVSSISKRTGAVSVEQRKVKQYLRSMKNNRFRYDSIDITSTDCYVIPESVREIGDGLYECVLSYTQWFRAKRREGPDYEDKTDKAVRVVFERVVIEGEIRWLIWLGDIYVTLTTQI